MESREFDTGAIVIYGLHGKCQITGVETRSVAGQSLRFYKLELQKSALSRSTRQDPAIWLPVASAREKGLRNPVCASEIESVYQVLQSREFYFPLSENWNVVQPKLENAIRSEGSTGLAKVISYLHVLKKKHHVLPSDSAKFLENVTRVFCREICEVTGETPRELEDRIAKGMRQKLLPDQ